MNIVKYDSIEEKEGYVLVIRMLSPFSISMVERTFHEWSFDKSIDSYLPNLNIIEDAGVEFVVSVNGKIIEDEEHELTFLSSGDSIVICPIPTGGKGGGAKKILSIVAMIAVSVYAPGLGTSLATSMGVAGATGIAAVQFGVGLVGNMLISAIMAPSTPDRTSPGISSSADSFSYSNSYGYDGPLNISKEGVVVPVVYGTFRSGGNLINAYIENVNDTQYIYLLFAASEGEIADITSLELNDQPIANFSQVEYEVRKGTPNQTPTKWFYDVLSQIQIGQTMTQAYSNYNTTDIVDRIRFDVIFPRGIYRVSTGDGKTYSHSVPFRIEYRKKGASAWSVITDTVASTKKSAIRKSYYTPILSPGVYETRFKRDDAKSTSDYIGDEIVMNELVQILTDDISYANTALVAVRVLLSEQLSSLPKVTFLVKGMLIPVWNGTAFVRQYSENPAWILLDMLTNKRYGASMALNRFDLERWKDWAKYCSDNGLTFNATMDSSLNLWDATQYILRAGHAQLLNVGTRYTVVIERASSPVMMFSVANMIENTFSQTWLPISDRANEIEVNYFDKADGYKQRSVKVYDPQTLSNGAPQRTSAVTLYGIVDYERAYKEAVLQLNLNRFLLQSVSFDAPMDAMACSVGDVVYVQHDMPQWGYAGRLEEGSTKSVINLDRPVSMTIGKLYKFLTVYDVVQAATGTITNIAGKSVYITGYSGTQAKRMVVDAKDIEVTSAFNTGGGVYGVTLENVNGLTIGSTYTLWDTDVIIERNVVNTDTTGSSITLQTALPQAPSEYQKFMFGENGKVKKPFRITGITGSHEYDRTISAIEYNESVYNPSGVAVATQDYSALTPIEHSKIDSVQEELYRVGNSIGIRATIYFINKHDAYRTSKVFLSRNGGDYVHIGNDASEKTVEVSDGEALLFRVVATNILGVGAPTSSAPTITHVVEGKKIPPQDILGFRHNIQANDVVLTWDKNSDLDIAGYQLREGISWDTSNLLTSQNGTSFTLKLSSPKIYHYHIKAFDTSGIYSNNSVMLQIDMTAPASVKGFNAVQSGNRIELLWKANAEEGIIYYEIREGGSWNASILISQSKSTSITTPAGAGVRNFWIKAVKAPGIYSESERLATSAIAKASNLNMLVTFDAQATGFQGIKHNVTTQGGAALLSASGGKIAEYLFSIDLGYHATTQNTSYTSFVALNQTLGSATWEDSLFEWDSPSANVIWGLSASLNNTDLKFQIATDSGLTTREVDAIPLHNTLNTIQGIVPSESLAASFADSGRYSSGLLVNQTTQVSWEVSIPKNFTHSVWVRPEDAGNMKLLTLRGTEYWLELWAKNGKILLIDESLNVVEVDRQTIEDETLLVAIVQTPTTRKLFVGDMNSNIACSEQPFVEKVGGYTNLQLY